MSTQSSPPTQYGAQWYRKAYQDFSGGLVTRPGALLLQANQFAQLDNALVSDHDFLEKLQGYALDAAAFPNLPTAFIRLLFNFRFGPTVSTIIAAAQDDTNNTNATYRVDIKQSYGNGVYNYIGYTVGTALFTQSSATVTGTNTLWLTNLKAGDKISPNSGTWYEILSVVSNTSITLTSNFLQTTTTSVPYTARIILNNSFIPRAAVFNNNLIIVNGSEGAMEYVTNSNMTKLQSPNVPIAQYIEPHKSRVFMARSAALPSGLWWSYANDETTWDQTSTTNIYAQDNGSIVAIKSFADSLVVFKDQGRIYQVLGNFDQNAQGQPVFIRRVDVPDNIGIIAGDTICINDDNKIYFLTQTGVYTLDSTMFCEKISWDIVPTINNITIGASPQNPKSYVYATDAQWNTGTFTGTKANASNQLQLICDRLPVNNSLTGVTPAVVGGYIAQAIDSSNNVHCAFMDSSVNGAGLAYPYYGQYTSSGTFVGEKLPAFPAPTPGLSGGLSVAVASNGNVGIAICMAQGTHNYLAYYERVSSGTVTLTNNSITVTGSGTTWTQILNTGSLIYFSQTSNPNDSRFYTVQNVASDTSLTLTAVYTGSSASGVAYSAWTCNSQVPVYGGSPILNTASNASTSISLQFSTNNPLIVYGVPSNVGTSTPCSFYRNGTFNSTTFPEVVFGTASSAPQISLTFSGSTAVCAYTDSTTNVHCYTSTNNGTSWTLVENFATATGLYNSTGIQCALDGSGHAVSVFGTVGGLIKRNHSTTTSTTLDSTANSFAGGYVIYSSGDYAMNLPSGSPQVEKYYYAGSTISGATTGQIVETSVNNGMGINSSSGLFSSIAHSANSNEFILRRLAFTGSWVSPETSDATLTAWGTYVVTGETDNGATVVHNVALSTTSSLPAPSPIISGATISTNNTLIFIQITVNFTIGSLVSPPVIGSITANYTGAGVSGSIAKGFVYNNELYITTTTAGNSANGFTVFLDRTGVWGDNTYSVGPMMRYSATGNLYGGSSTNGNIYILRQGYTFNGTSYTMTAVTKEDLLGSLELEKDIYKIYVIYQTQATGTFNFSYRLDNYTTVNGTTWNTTTVDQTQGPIAEVVVGQTASSIQMMVQASGNGPTGIVGFIILYGYLNAR